MTGAVIRPTMTRAAQAAVLGGVCARAGDGTASRNVMSSVFCEAISSSGKGIASSQTALTCPALFSGVAMTDRKPNWNPL